MIRILVAGGDCMLGRAVQLSLPVQTPGEELIRDSCTAQHYLDMCLNHPSGNDGDDSLSNIRQQNAHNGSYLWGDYKGLQITPPPDLKLLNLETAVTRSIDNTDVPHWKGIRYHMHTDNFETIVLSGFQAESHGGKTADPATTTTCATTIPLTVNCANNHIMDYGRKAFEQETLPLMDRLQKENDNFRIVRFGRSFQEASKPAVWDISSNNNHVPIEVFGFATGCSGTSSDWWATKRQSGLIGLPALEFSLHDNVEYAKEVARQVFDHAPSSHDPDNNKNNTLRIVSIHWGPNWAYRGEINEDVQVRRDFAHWLIDACGVDMIYGHSSHHCRGMEVYKGKLILYGTGDIINDYEGFENSGEEKYNRLGALYVVDLHATNGNLKELRIVPMYMNRLQLKRYSPPCYMWHPKERMLVKSLDKARDFVSFLNQLSVSDAGGTPNALKVKYVENDPQIPGGPILRSTMK
jgi:poly-gamma-glutamate synthesis protein (capsule biosynthesis protein)